MGLDSERQIQLVVQTDLSFQCTALNQYVHISNSSLISNLLGNKYDSTLFLCYVTIFCCFRFHYSDRAVKDGGKKEGEFIKQCMCVCIYIYIVSPETRILLKATKETGLKLNTHIAKHVT
jgi:hypothetical protein